MLKAFSTNFGTLYVEEGSGEVFATLSSAGKICGVDHTRIRQLLSAKKAMESGVALNNKCAKGGLIAEEGEAELTTALTFGGEQRGVNITEAQLLYCIVTHKPELAFQFAQAGLRVYLHGLMGFKYEVKAPEQPKLSPVDRVNTLASSLQYFKVDVNNPRYNLALQDIVLTELGVLQAQKALTSEEWLGVREMAERLGFMQTATKHASVLGKLVKKALPDAEVTTGKQLVGGLPRPVRLYKVTQEFSETVREICEQLE